MLNNKKIDIRIITTVGILSAVAMVLTYFEFNPPLTPGFLKLDFSDFPALFAAFAINPFAALAVELLKNLFKAMSTNTGGIGELANFVMGSSLCLVAGYVYGNKKTLKNAVLALVFGSFAMAVAGAIMNYFVILPIYSEVMGFPMPAIIGMCSSVFPFIHTKLDVIFFSILPFNILKGFAISITTFVFYKRLRPILNGKLFADMQEESDTRIKL